MGYAEESRRKAWVFYKTPFCYFDSPAWPSASAAFMRPEGYAEVFRAWHGNNGRSLGNPRLAFVFTHMLFRGDPYDAGYFVEDDQDLAPGDTYRTNWGEDPPPMHTLALDPADWNAERRYKAAVNYHYGYIGDAVQHLVAAFGLEAAAEVVEHAYRVFLLQTRERLAGYLDVSLDDPQAPAVLLARYNRLFREEVVLEGDGDGLAVRRSGSQLNRYLAQPLPAQVDTAVDAAWESFARFLSPAFSLRAEGRAGGGDASWAFRPA
jgi:hypothetical protein